MGRGALLVCGVACSLLLSLPAVGAGLPPCRVRVVGSGAPDEVSKTVLAQVQAWVDARERGVRLVPIVDEADVILELRDYRPKTMSDGTPAEEWLLVARRLAGSDLRPAIHRFGYVTFLDRRTKDHLAQTLPTVLSDVCLGYLPKEAKTLE